jgi:hypothetical protein
MSATHRIDPTYEYIRNSKLSSEGAWICRLCWTVVPDDSRIRQGHRSWHLKVQEVGQ